MGKPLAIGAAVALASMGATGVYIASITIDDGLETLIYFPILAIVVALAAGWCGWSQKPVSWAVQIALGAAGATWLTLLALALGRADPLLIAASTSVAFVVAGIAVISAVAGWATAGAIRQLLARVHGGEPRA